MSSSTPLFRTAFTGLVLSTLLLSGCGTGEQAAPQAAAAQTPAPEVSVVTLKAEDITLTRELPGRINASLVAEVRPQVSGIIKERLFTEGGYVKAGQPLYQLEDATYQAELQRAEASLARAKATLESAEITAKRMAALVKIDAVSQQDNDDAQAALLQARAEVKVAEAALTSAKVTLGYSRITAPISGYIGKSAVTAGALVTINQNQPLATIQKLDPIYIDLTQSSSELLQMRKAMAAGTLTRQKEVPVTLLLEDGSRYAQEGSLAFTEMTVDPTTGSYALRVEVPNPESLLMPGMYARAILAIGSRSQALLVPQQGIARDPKGNTNAMVIGADGTVEARPVRVSRTIGDRWLVEEGLNVGDQVIVAGLQKIKPGIPVRTVEVSPEVAKDAGTSVTSGQ